MRLCWSGWVCVLGGLAVDTVPRNVRISRVPWFRHKDPSRSAFYDAFVASRISVARRFTNLIRSGPASVCSMAVKSLWAT